MKQKMCIVLFALTVLVSACSNVKEAENPFVGYWRSEDIGSEENPAFCELRINFNATDSMYKAMEILGTFYMFDCQHGIGEFSSLDMIRSQAKGANSNETLIEYHHQQTGDLWSATLVYNPETMSITFINGKMLKKGVIAPNTNQNELPATFDIQPCVVPETVLFSFLSANPHYEEAPLVEPSLESVEYPDNEYRSSVELSDRIIYEEDNQAGERELQCRYNGSNDVTTIVDMNGESPLSMLKHVVTGWATSDGKGALLVLEEGGTEFTTLTLIHVNADNRIEEIDLATGLSPNNQIVGPENITDDMLPSITKVDGRIRVYSPSDETPQTRFYDLNGTKLP